MVSIWQATGGDHGARQFPPVGDGVEADVVVIGGGITGLSTALALAEGGERVVVLEAHRIGDGNTGGSTGNLYSTLAEGLASLRGKWDDRVLAEVVSARASAVDAIEANVGRFGIECQFHRRPLYFALAGSDARLEERLERERDACAAAGVEASIVDNAPLPFHVPRALQIDAQAQFNPSAYVRGLADAVAGLGVAIHEHSRVVQVESKQGVVLKTGHGVEVKAREVVHATHTPLGISVLQTVMIPSREYGISARLRGQAPPEGIFWVLDPFHSIRSHEHEGTPYLVVVGEKHKTGEQGGDYHARLRDYASTHFDVESFEHAWSAQQYSSGDGLPYIGRAPAAGNASVATGFGANGLVWGTVAGALLGDSILGRDNPLLDRFSPRRFTPVKSAGQWLKENMSVASHLVGDRLSHASRERLDEIKPGEGRIVSLDGDKVAAHRSTAGELSVLSAICPHMKCLVHWNPADDTWDCPCHGSRFAVDGSVIEGPAYHGLMQRTPEK